MKVNVHNMSYASQGRKHTNSFLATKNNKKTDFVNADTTYLYHLVMDRKVEGTQTDLYSHLLLTYCQKMYF